MKKMVCMLLAVSLLSAMAVPAFAEELDVTAEDIAVTLEAPEEGHGLELKDAASFAADGADVVTVDGNSYTVDTGDVTFQVELDPSLGFLCLTQDLMASLEQYFMLTDDPEGLMNSLIADDTHLLFLSMYSMMEVDVYTMAPDDFSESVGTLSEQSDVMKEAYAALFAPANGFDNYELKEIGSNTWIALTPDFYCTFVNGNYVVISVYTQDGGEMTEDDVLDLEDLLACFTITAD